MRDVQAWSISNVFVYWSLCQHQPFPLNHPSTWRKVSQNFHRHSSNIAKATMCPRVECFCQRYLPKQIQEQLIYNHISIEGVNETMIGLGLIKDQPNWNFGLYNTPHIFRRLGSSESMMEVDDCPDLRLDGLPNELLLHIFQYLDVEFILQAVSKVLSILSATIRCNAHVFYWRCATFSTSWPPTRQPGGSEWPKDSQVEIPCSLLPWFV